MGTKEKEEQAVDPWVKFSDAFPEYFGNPDREEAAYDKGYDDGWQARDEMAGRHQKQAEQTAYDNGWLAGVKDTLNRKPYLPLAVD